MEMARHSLQSCIAREHTSTLYLQAQLVSHAQQMGVEDSGTKHVLVDRLHALVSTDLAAQSQVADGRQVTVSQLLKTAAINLSCVTARCDLPV